MKRAVGIKLNLIANLVGKAWSGLIAFLFIPFYVRMLGVEAYGLIGVYIALTAIIQVLDLGLTTTINREMARLSALENTQQEERDLVRTLESVYWLIGLCAGVAIMALAPAIAHRWVHTQTMSPQTVQRAILLMGGLFMLQWPDSFYAGGLMGMERQVLLNGVRVAFATLQAVGAALVLKFIAPTILAYFLWQALAYGTQTLVLMFCVWRLLPAAPHPARFRRELGSKNARFTAGVTGIALLAIVLTQLDKVLLSNQLPLKLFGYYALANTLASNMLYPVAPLFGAVFPRMAQLATRDDRAALATLYHKSCQLLSLIVIPIWIIVALFSRQLLALYLHNAETVDHVHLLLSLLVTGTALNALMTLPFGLQLAYGYTRLSLYKNMVAVILFVPALRWMVLHEGAVGAAWMWIAVNGAYIFTEIPLMHRRLLPGEMGRWYLLDVGLPLLITIAVVAAARWIIRDTLPLPAATVGIGLAALLAFGAAALTVQWAQRRSTAAGLGMVEP